MFKFRPGDQVRIIGDTQTGEIINIINDIAIVKYQRERKKIAVVNLLPARYDGGVRITPEKFDDIVKDVIAETVKRGGGSEDLETILELIAATGSEIKERLFYGED